MKTKFKIVGLALTLVAVIWVYREHGRNGVQGNIKMIPSKLRFYLTAGDLFSDLKFLVLRFYNTEA